MENTPNNLLPALPHKNSFSCIFPFIPTHNIPIITCIQAQVDNMDKNNTNNNQNYDLTSDHTADDEEAPTPSRATIIWNRVLKITLLVDLVLILLVGSYCLYKYIGGDEIVPPAADLEYNPQPFNKELAREVLDYQDPNQLMSAIATDQPIAAIQKILDSGIDVNAQDATGNTALHYAIFREDRKLLKLLLNHGSNRRIKNHKEQSCTDVSFQISPRKIGFIIIAPEDYDDNGIITRAALIKDSVDDSTIIFIFIIPFIFLGWANLFAFFHRSYKDDQFGTYANTTLKNLLLNSLKFFFFLFSICLLISCIYLYFIPYPYQFIIANYNTQFPKIGLFIGAALVIRFFYVIRMYASIE